MLSLRRKGLIVVLDIVNSTKMLTDLKKEGEDGLIDIVSAIATAFWSQNAETIAFTGDGLLAFIEDSGRPARMCWALFDALRAAEERVIDFCLSRDVKVGLRGAVHFGTVLEIGNGAFAGQLIGRTVFQMEEICDAARAGDWRPGIVSSIAAMKEAVEYCQLPVHDCPIWPDEWAKTVSGGDHIYLLDQPELTILKTASWFDYAQNSSSRPGVSSRTSHRGLVLYLKLQADSAGPAFPRRTAYLDCMKGMIDLILGVGGQVLNLMPTAILGFIEDPGQPFEQLEGALEAVMGDGVTYCPGRALLKKARRRGWTDVRLCGGVAYGEIVRPQSGPLAFQALGRVLAFAARFATLARKYADKNAGSDLCVAGPFEGEKIPLKKEYRPSSFPDLWRTPIFPGYAREPISPKKLKVKNLAEVGYKQCRIWAGSL